MLAVTARDLAKARWDEAAAVRAAFGSQVVKRRRDWLAASPEKRDRARAALAHAVAQEDAAKDNEQEAWREWSRVSGA